jgi:hypothetical protein
MHSAAFACEQIEMCGKCEQHSELSRRPDWQTVDRSKTRAPELALMIKRGVDFKGVTATIGGSAS